MALHSIELFAGVGMLGEGVRAGLDFLGIDHRSVCYVEREAYAAAVLVARMEEGSLDAAPVWSDVTTFNAHDWRGKVDCVIAGFPCQDLSVAGKRAGLDGKRSGLFFEVTRIAADSGAWLLILENVGGIASATATVMDEEEGELEERAAARVVGELADLGWNAEWLHLSASDVGASHGRERWFCLAWRVGYPGHDAGNAEQRQQSQGTTCGAGEPGAAGAGRHMADSPLIGWRQGRPESEGQQGRLDATECRCAVADSDGAKRGQIGIAGAGGQQGHDRGRRQEDCGVGVAITSLANADRRQRCADRRGSAAEPDGWNDITGCCADMAHPSRPRQQGREQRTALHSDRGGGASTWIS